MYGISTATGWSCRLSLIGVIKCFINLVDGCKKFVSEWGLVIKNMIKDLWKKLQSEFRTSASQENCLTMRIGRKNIVCNLYEEEKDKKYDWSNNLITWILRNRRLNLHVASFPNKCRVVHVASGRCLQCTIHVLDDVDHFSSRGDSPRLSLACFIACLDELIFRQRNYRLGPGLITKGRLKLAQGIGIVVF